MTTPSAVALSPHVPAFAFDVRLALPPGWDRQVLDCAMQHSRWQEYAGVSVTSREAQHAGEDALARAGVVAGDVLATELPWLIESYEGLFLSLANELGRGTYCASPDLRSAVNVNTIRPGDRYEWHVDSNPLTGLLFVTTHSADEGGTLVFRRENGLLAEPDGDLRVQPYGGTLLLFDAREIAHSVTMVRGSRSRVTVPMNFYEAGRSVERPSDLDQYLYG